MGRFVFFLLFVSFLLSLPSAAKRATRGFKIGKMELHFPNRPEWEMPLDPTLRSLLEQPFTYLSKGAQCYVFESEDRQFVIKLFRYDHPVNYEKVETLFNACKIAHDHLQEETALLYIHLNQTNLGLPILKCSDPIGRTVRIRLDQSRFAIQKKGEPFFDRLDRALSNEGEMKRQIDRFVDLVVSRARKGVLNTDRSLGTNFGFVGERAVEFDFGNYRLVSGLEIEGEVRRYTSQLEAWLSERAPEWVSYLEKQVESSL